jgi:hypothetical protein
MEVAAEVRSWVPWTRHQRVKLQAGDDDDDDDDGGGGGGDDDDDDDDDDDHV